MNTVIYAHCQSKYTGVLAKFPIVSNFLKSLESFLTHVSHSLYTQCLTLL